MALLSVPLFTFGLGKSNATEIKWVVSGLLTVCFLLVTCVVSLIQIQRTIFNNSKDSEQKWYLRFTEKATENNRKSG